MNDRIGWRHRWLHVHDPMQAFQIWVDARWDGPPVETCVPEVAEAYASDPEVPREMTTPRAPMPDDPF